MVHVPGSLTPDWLKVGLRRPPAAPRPLLRRDVSVQLAGKKGRHLQLNLEL